MQVALYYQLPLKNKFLKLFILLPTIFLKFFIFIPSFLILQTLLQQIGHMINAKLDETAAHMSRLKEGNWAYGEEVIALPLYSDRMHVDLSNALRHVQEDTAAIKDCNELVRKLTHEIKTLQIQNASIQDIESYTACHDALKEYKVACMNLRSALSLLKSAKHDLVCEEGVSSDL